VERLNFVTGAAGWLDTCVTPAGASPNVDRWILSRQQTLIRRATEEMEAYRLYNVVPALVDFPDELTNWYVRLNRRRF
jgi:isoleucyl-tRNA synthetase